MQQHSQLMSWHCSYPSIRSVYFESGNMAHKSREMISFWPEVNFPSFTMMLNGKWCV